MADRVRLRPVTSPDLDALERMFADQESIGVFNWAGWSNPWAWRRRWEDNGLLAEDRSVLMVETLDGELLGFVSWTPAFPPASFLCWDVGISLWPNARGQGYGTEAQRLLARYLFAHTQVNRIQASTEVDNVAEQRSLEKAGFTREGVTRGTMFRDGAWRDEVLYSMLRSEIPPG